VHGQSSSGCKGGDCEASASGSIQEAIHGSKSATFGKTKVEIDAVAGVQLSGSASAKVGINGVDAQVVICCACVLFCLFVFFFFLLFLG
jgi:hypothetical protein